jgi:hypothetical protein
MSTKTFPAPVRGWIENENLAANQGLGCSVLENGFPLTSTVRMRGGALTHNFIGESVQSLLPWRSGSTNRLFATGANGLYDLADPNGTEEPINPALEVWPGETEVWPGATELWFGYDPGESGLVPITALVPGFGGAFSYVQMDTGGSTPFLVAANGVNPMIYYDGTDWNPINGVAVNHIPFDALTADFIIGQTVTGGASGATAVIIAVIKDDATTGKIKVGAISGGPFQDNEALTSATGAATASAASSAASAVVITNITTSAISHVWVHAERLFMVQGGTMKAWYLPVDAIGGAALAINLGGVFKEGGSLLFGATWSADSGSGLGDRCVFVSTEGEVAVYAGINPASANTWEKVGLYNIGRPISTQVVKAGGDLLIATTDGIVPLSAVTQKDPAALSMAAVSYPIEPAWRRVTESIGTTRVQMLKWATEGMLIVGYPHRGPKETHVANVQTGAWARWTNHNVQCMALHNDRAYFGDSEGYIMQFEGSGSDRGTPYTMRLSGLPDHLKSPGAYKTAEMARATFRALAPFVAKLSVATDYRREFPTPPNADTTQTAAALWDVGLWDVSKWDDGPDSEARQTATTKWRSINRSGHAMGPQVQITSGAARKPDVELVSVDLLYNVGEVVV